MDKVNWTQLSSNPNAISILEENLDKINWFNFCVNINAIPIIEKNLESNLDKIKWSSLSINPNAIYILEKNLDKINWDILSENPNAIRILKNNVNKINWECLSVNLNGFSILEKNLYKVDIPSLISNPNAIPFIIKNYEFFLQKTNKELREQSGEDYDYEYTNESLIKNIIFSNENGYQLFLSLDYEKTKKNNKKFAEELVSYVFHPKRVLKKLNEFIDDGRDIEDFWDNI